MKGKKYLEFLRYCLDETLPLPESSSKINWMRMMDWAESQGIVGVVFQGIERGSKGQGPQEKLEVPFDDLAEWIGYMHDIEEQNKLVNQHCVEIVDAFQKDGFETCILKGQGNAMMYPNPLLRNPGDIDLFVLGHTDDTDSTDKETSTNLTNGTSRVIASREMKQKSDSKLIKKIIRYVRKRNPGAKANYHHVDYGEYEDVEVEVHYRPSFANNLFVNRRLQRWFKAHTDITESTDKICPADRFGSVDLPEGAGRIPVPNGAFNIVFQLSHMYRHVIQSGLGLRQIVDYYYLLKEEGRWKKEESRRKREEVVETLRYLGLMEMAGAVMWVLKEMLGLEEQYLIAPVDERRGRFLLSQMLQGGNFGMGLTPDKGWLSNETTIGRNMLRLKRDAQLLRYFPSECLWEPVFRIYHFIWRLAHR